MRIGSALVVAFLFLFAAFIALGFLMRDLVYVRTELAQVQGEKQTLITSYTQENQNLRNVIAQLEQLLNEEQALKEEAQNHVQKLRHQVQTQEDFITELQANQHTTEEISNATTCNSQAFIPFSGIGQWTLNTRAITAIILTLGVIAILIIPGAYSFRKRHISSHGHTCTRRRPSSHRK